MSERDDEAAPVAKPLSEKPLVAPDRTRIPALDALRGIGAMTVGLWHLYVTLPHDTQMNLVWILWTPVRLIHPTIIIFYLISGFVLGLPYFDATPPGYGRYLIKRMCRLYIPFIVVLCGAFVLYKLTGTDSDFINGVVFHSSEKTDFAPFTWQTLGRSLLLTGLQRDEVLNPSMWTMVNEVRISLIFPLLVLLCRRTWIGVAFMALCYVFVLMTQNTIGRFLVFPGLTDDYLTTWLSTIYFIPCFMFGIFLARYRERIHHFLTNLSPRRRRILWVLVIINFCFMPEYDMRQPFTELGACPFLMLILSSDRLSRILKGGVLQWLGKISFSLYLVHLPILFILKNLLSDRLSIGFIYAIFFPVTFLVAYLVNRFVERPATDFGRRLSGYA